MKANERFREALRREREARGWTRVELARRMGRHRQQVDQIESGATSATLVTVQLVADALGVDPSVFFRADALENGGGS